MLLIPVENDEITIANGFRKAPMFVFLDPESGIMLQENHYKTEKSPVFFEHFVTYDIDTLYVKGLGYKTFLKLKDLGIEVYLIPEDISLYTHIDPNELILLTDDNAEIYCTMGHHNKASH